MQYVLFAKSSREVLDLGEKSTNAAGFEGPLVFIDGDYYFLPEDLLTTLLLRFKEVNGKSNVIQATEDEVFETSRFKDYDDEVFLIVGGDSDLDPTFFKYLPELKESETKSRIKSKKNH